MTIPSFTLGYNHVPGGEVTFISPDGLDATYTWTVPVGVTSISAVCVGGGGGGGNAGGGGGGGGALAYVNNISVTPGEDLTIVVGRAGAAQGVGGISSIRNSSNVTLVAAGGGGGGTASGGTGGTVITGTGFAGGSGANGGAGSRPGGGGGAGGYAGVGGDGSVGASNPAAPTGGSGGAGGGGRGSTSSTSVAGTGGGVGVGIGSGTSGLPGVLTTGEDLITYGSYAEGFEVYGGGSYGGSSTINGIGAQPGVVKIVWSYPPFNVTRSFPSTRVFDSTDFILVQHYTTTVASNQITIPSGISVGDFAFLFDSGRNNSTTIPTAVTPTGFISIVNTGQSSTQSGRSICSYKILTNADANTTITGMNAATANSKVLIIFRPNQPIVGINTVVATVSTPNAQSTTGANPTNQTLSMSGINSTKTTPVAYFAHYRADSTTITRGSSGAPFFEVTGSDSTRHYVRYGEYHASDSPINATISMSSTGDTFNILQSFYVQFRTV